jgi:hydroxyacylglutathione hydrolase
VIFSQYYLECLSHASYLVGDEGSGVAAVVDPQRDVSAYLADAGAHGLDIRYVIETHFHADFLSGHLELADRTGAEICYGPGAETAFPSRILADGERLALGDVELEVRATPGHTPESISVVVHEPGGRPYGVLTGDTLFIGDVGRPDLLTSAGMSAEDLARLLHRSLHQKLLTLPDETRVFPAHGAGSACGKQLSTETQSTIGEQRRTNHALAPLTEDEFVAMVTEGQPTTPVYFSFDASRNRELRPLLDEEAPPPPLTLAEVLALQADGAVVLDTRDPVDYATGHLAGSVNVGLLGRFAEYVGDVIEPEDRIVVVCDPGAELEAKVRLGRIGFDVVVGHLVEPVQAFLDRPDAIRRSSRLTAAELEGRMAAVPGLVVIDVRNPGEVTGAGAIDEAVRLPLALLASGMAGLDPARPTVCYCAGGYRSSIAASVLRRAGFADVSDLLGGYQAWLGRSADRPI